MQINLPDITDPDLLSAIEQEGKLEEFAAGQVLIQPGQYIKMIPIVLEGALKVMRTDDEGHELFLYYIEPGQTCAVSLSCCSTSVPSTIKAVAEDKATILSIAVSRHEEWMNSHRQWKNFVSRTYQQRFQEMLHAIDDIAFKKMDERLLSYLLTKTRQLNTHELSITHQQIASELGSSREVISRLLKQLEKRKLVELGRNKIYTRADLEQFSGKKD